MDSGNSGSLQSSSGGDDEYDPRNESISAFLNSTRGVFLASQQQHQPQLPLHTSSSHHHLHQNPNHTTPSLFDHPNSNYFNVLSRSIQPPPQNPNSPLNIDKVWSRNLRSDANSTDVSAVMGSSCSSSTQPVLGGAHRQVISVATPIQNPSSMSSPRVSDNTTLRTSPSDQPNQFRQSKKRSRASRRAPTTVLTTDTSNFRAMVQEFTGIPAPTFSASPFARSRNDLFNTASPVRSSHLEPIRPPPYLLRPFAQKVQPPPPICSSHFTSSDMTSNSISSNNFQLLSELGFSKPSHNQVNMQNNSILTFQTLLQSTLPQKFSSPNSSGLVENSRGVSSNAIIAPLDDLPNFVTSDVSNRVDGDGNQDRLRSFNENYSNPQRGNSCNEKGSDQNDSSRGGGEGTVDSWINSSD